VSLPESRPIASRLRISDNALATSSSSKGSSSASMVSPVYGPLSCAAASVLAGLFSGVRACEQGSLHVSRAL